MFPSSNPSFSYIDDENPNSEEDHPPSSSFLYFPAPFLDNKEVVLLHPTHLLPQRTHMSQDNTRSGGRVEDPSEINAAAAAAPAPNNTTSAVDKEKPSRDVAADLHQEESTTPEVPPTMTMKKKKKSSDGSGKKSVPRKRTGKKDRHSKIYTAQGPRDRRMRLSLQIARKFFDLQDMLGFDKASKTIEWLFTKSKAAIKELTSNLPQIKHIGGGTGASTETKGTSKSKEFSHIKGIDPDCGITTNSELSLPHTTSSPKEKKNRKPRSKSALNPLAKESREKARARARERTREKMIMRSLEKCSEAAANPNNLEQLVGVPSSGSPLETGESSRSREMSSASLEMVEEHSAHSLEHQMATVGIIEKFLGIPRSSSTSSPIFNYIPPNNNNFSCFPENWDMDNSIRIHPGGGNYSAMTSMGCPLSTDEQISETRSSNSHYARRAFHKRASEGLDLDLISSVNKDVNGEMVLVPGEKHKKERKERRFIRQRHVSKMKQSMEKAK